MLRFVLKSFLIWRIAIFLPALLSLFLLPQNLIFRQDALLPWERVHLIFAWAGFDGIHYLDIAQEGYAGFQQAFFPFFPLILRFLKFLTGNYLTSGFFISHLAFFAALVLFFKLIRLDFKENIAKLAILFILFFPTSFFFGSLYTESIFLFLVVASFYSARRGNWLLAGVFGFFASLTRLVGVFLFPALLVELYLQNFSPPRCTAGATPPRGWSLVKIGLPLLLIPLGLGLYVFYLYLTYKDPLLFLHAQSIWQRGETVLLPQVLFRYLKIFLTVPVFTHPYAIALFEFLTTVGFLFLVVYSFIKTRISYAVFAALAYLAPTTTGTLSSMPRYVLVLFPCFITLSLLVKSKITAYLLIGIFSLMAFGAIFLFTRGWWLA